jgi:hypothetical protein
MILNGSGCALVRISKICGLFCLRVSLAACGGGRSDISMSADSQSTEITWLTDGSNGLKATDLNDAVHKRGLASAPFQQAKLNVSGGSE